jgi:hypothetical protein
MWNVTSYRICKEAIGVIYFIDRTPGFKEAALIPQVRPRIPVGLERKAAGWLQHGPTEIYCQTRQFFNGRDAWHKYFIHRIYYLASWKSYVLTIQQFTEIKATNIIICSPFAATLLFPQEDAFSKSLVQLETLT